jgi:ABC-2 type transport system permease protein
MSTLRIVFVGGRISYRALFNWIHPAMYVPTMLLGPIFQILFFVYLGRYNRLQSDAFYVVGNAVQMSGMAGIYASTMAIANERQFGTLAPLLATPAARLPIFVGRMLPVAANGLIVSAWGFGVGALLLGFRPPASSLPALALVVAVSVFSCTTFGFTLGSFGMRARDVFLISNLAYYVLWLFCGVNVPLSALPGWMATIGRGLPFTHGIAAARAIAGGASLGSVGGQVLGELAVGAVYLVVAFGLFRAFEAEGRRRASLETY